MLDETSRTVAANIRRLRRMADLTQTDIGRAVGVTPQQIYKYETGQSRISAHRLHALAAALSASIDDLFRRDH